MDCATCASTNVSGSSTSQDTINAAGPLLYWRLNEKSGTSAGDDEGADNGTYGVGVTLGVPGPLVGNSDPGRALARSSE